MANKLFTEFSPVSTEQWEEVITKDLKGADYEKKLVWRTLEGFNVRPYYRAADLKGIKYVGSAPGKFPYVRGNRQDNNWYIHQGISCMDNDFKKANEEAKLILTKGIESICFYVDNTKVQTKEDYSVLLSDIALEKVPVFFCNTSLKTRESLINFVAYLDSLSIDKDSVKVCFDYAPLRVLTSNGHFCEDKAFNYIAECIKAVADYKNMRVISIDAFTFNSCGASSVQELAFALSQGSEYLSRLTELGVSVKEIAKRMIFSFAVGSNYFMEIAKFRAARLLWANIVEEYGTDSACAEKMRIFATTSEWNQTVYDAYVNMLRATTEAMSASIAGVDYLEVVPFDFAFRVPTDFSNRIARNVQNILKEESHFNKIVDPAAGSYYIENLTNSVANAAWELFKKVEAAGGYVAQFKAGFIQSEIKTVSDKRDKNIATRRDTLLGINQFPNFLEKAEAVITKDIVSRDIPTMMGMKMEEATCCSTEKMAEPLRPYRGSEAFETLRLATDRSGKEPKAFMLTFGNLAMCRARAQFSSNFFAVAGIKVVDNNRFATVEEGVEAALKANSEIVVACSADDEYLEAVPRIAQLLGDKAILVVAGDPECRPALEEKGITNFIHVKCNVLDTLKEYQKMLGIKEL